MHTPLPDMHMFGESGKSPLGLMEDDRSVQGARCRRFRSMIAELVMFLPVHYVILAQTFPSTAGAE